MTFTTFVAVSVEPRRGALVVAAPARLLSPPTSRPRPSTHRAWRPPLRRAAAAGATPATSTSDAPVVVVGGGIVGCAVAYFLSERGRNVTVVEPVAIAAAASGKAGGFLARSWGDGGPTQELHRRGWDLHAELAERLSLASYRRIPVYSVEREGLGGGGPAPAWVSGPETSSRPLDLEGGAQVSPLELTTRLFEASGARLVKGAVRGLEFADDGDDRTFPRCVGVHVRAGSGAEKTLIEASEVVVCAGPWSTLLADWLSDAGVSGTRNLPITGIKSTHVTFKPPTDLPGGPALDPAALFCSTDKHGCTLEVYPRPDGSVYLCGIGGSDYVDDICRLREGGDCGSADLVTQDPTRVAAAVASFARLAPGASDSVAGEPDSVGACMRPCPPDAKPILGRVAGVEGLSVATGTNCWGILASPTRGRRRCQPSSSSSCRLSLFIALVHRIDTPPNRHTALLSPSGGLLSGKSWPSS